ncbi:MAG: 50S ribosomal protein L35 [Candidatus Paceibacterota bacterium]
MHKGKTRKSISKRFKMTRTGKIMRRPTGQDHLNVKCTGKQRRNKKGWIPLNESEYKAIKKALKYWK